jgi:hypothetical protein
MAVTVDVLKLTQVQGVVAVRGVNATGTIDIDSTLKKSTETVSSVEVNLKGLQWTLASGTAAQVERNGKVLYELSGTGEMEFYGFTDNDENDQDIDIVIDNGGAGGTVIVNCAKVAGFGPQQHQGADGDLG